MKTYPAKRTGYINYLLIGTLLLPFITYWANSQLIHEKPFILLPILAPFLLILWGYLNTIYRIEKEELVYRSAFLGGRIAISNISEIVKGKTMWSGIKPALARKGLIIKFNKYDEIYIAPKNNEELISDLLKINPDIKITE